MCLDSLFSYSKNSDVTARNFKVRNVKNQRGFLIPTALFIVVALGALAISIARMAGSANSIALREALSAQAFFAAESGAQLALYNLFNGATTRAQTTTNCSTIDVVS